MNISGGLILLILFFLFIVGMVFVRINILGYKNNRLTAVIVFANSSDEYQIMLNITIQNNVLYIDSYNSMCGMVKGL